MTSVLTRRATGTDMHTGGQGDVSLSQGSPAPPKLERGWTRFPQEQPALPTPGPQMSASSPRREFVSVAGAPGPGGFVTVAGTHTHRALSTAPLTSPHPSVLWAVHPGDRTFPANGNTNCDPYNRSGRDPCFLSPQPWTCLLILREKGGGRERSINCLPPIRAPTGDQTHNLGVHGMMLQPAGPPGQGWAWIL